jgi:O-antigen ligase
MAVAIINDTVIWEFVYAFIFAAIAASYLPLMRGAYVRGLWMLALGAALGFAGHWGHTLGLPMTGKVYEHFIRGGERMGSGRGDVNWASVNVGLGMWTLIALIIPYVWAEKNRYAPWLTILAAAIFVAGALPLIVMGSRAGLVYLILGGLFIIAYTLITRRFAAKAAAALTIAVLTLLVFGPVAWYWAIETEPGQRLLATIEFNRLQSEQYGTGEGIAGRSNQWFAFLDIVAQYPLAGVPRGEVVNFGEYGTAAVSEGAGGGAWYPCGGSVRHRLRSADRRAVAPAWRYLRFPVRCGTRRDLSRLHESFDRQL